MPEKEEKLFRSDDGLEIYFQTDKRKPTLYRISPMRDYYTEKELLDLADTIVAILPAKPEAPKVGKRVSGRTKAATITPIDKEKCKACGIKEICALSAGGAIHEDCSQLKKEG